MAAASLQFATTNANPQIANPQVFDPLPGQNADLIRIVREGLSQTPKRLPPWLFYDEAGSILFDRITELPEYYLTRIERNLFAEYAGEMIAAASESSRLRLIELGAGSADKTRMLLSAVLERQETVQYQPVDVSRSALESACERLAIELPEVEALPLVADYTREWNALANSGRLPSERSLVLWIGSSIGNFEPSDAITLLRRIHDEMQPGDGLLLGVDLVPCAGGKCVGELISAYDDEAGVTSDFNRNLLVRLNRELDADFDLDAFTHCAVWNETASRIEMHLESLSDQWVHIDAARLDVHFKAGERLHTENSYKYTQERAAELIAQAGFPAVETWTDHAEWFAVLLGRKA